jgi:formylglycine-generating enzyme required for sulfatase activity
VFRVQFVLVKGGAFDMGDVFGDGDVDEKPSHRVTVSSFYLGRYPVTQAQWKTLMGHNPSCFKGPDRPVESVSWNDVQAFLRKISERTERDCRLPTEAEWEYAARSAGQRERWAGTSDPSELPDHAWYRANSRGQTHAVGQKTPNSLGLHDMTGNVWEWCSDWYDEVYYQKYRLGQDERSDDLGFRLAMSAGQ